MQQPVWPDKLGDCPVVDFDWLGHFHPDTAHPLPCPHHCHPLLVKPLLLKLQPASAVVAATARHSVKSYDLF